MAETCPLKSVLHQTFQYTGRENDGTGLYYYRARYYAPGIQRFISEDPLNGGGSYNAYSYADDDPINFIDPFGLKRRYSKPRPKPPGNPGVPGNPGAANNGQQPPNPPQKPNSPNYGAGLCAATPALQLRHYGGCSYVCEFVYDDPFDIRIGGMHATGPAIDAACGPGRFCPALVTVEKDNPGATEPVRILSCVP